MSSDAVFPRKQRGPVQIGTRAETLAENATSATRRRGIAPTASVNSLVAVIDIFPEQADVFPADAYPRIFGLQATFILFAIVTYLGAHDPRRDPR
jgi:hypothetical protein